MGIGTSLPSDFPLDAYENVAAAGRRWLAGTGQGNKPPPVVYEFAGAWNALAYRFLACWEHCESFTNSIQKSPNDHRDLYEQEKDLFGFFLNGLSVFESYYYGIYCLAAMLRPNEFPIEREEDRKKVSLSSSGTKTFENAFSNNEISPALKGLLKSGKYDEWNKIRNVLVHRAAPPRNHYLGAPKSGTSDVWKESRLAELGPLDQKTTKTRRRWLADRLRELLDAADSFSMRMIP